MSQPAAVSSAICCRVALTSEVSVVVIDCTDTGASPPTATDPTWIWRDLRRGASTGGGEAGIPSETVTPPVSPRLVAGRWPTRGRRKTATEAGGSDVDGVDDVRVERQQR